TRVWVSVSFDHKKDDWTKLLRKEQFPWLQLSNGKPWKENPIAKQWDLHWIPTFFIIDPQGRIAASAITAEELGKKLQEIGQNGK
ncbi:MAG: TlpA family protein disulfide reductase, partial [Bacteroidaceae bacterium]